MIGTFAGACVGALDGASLMTGAEVGGSVSATAGLDEGFLVRLGNGGTDGSFNTLGVGNNVGFDLGLMDGSCVGSGVASGVGCAVGSDVGLMDCSSGSLGVGSGVTILFIGALVRKFETTTGGATGRLTGGSTGASTGDTVIGHGKISGRLSTPLSWESHRNTKKNVICFAINITS
jgi:hypothetical protein